MSGEPLGNPPVGFMTPGELGRGNQVRGQGPQREKRMSTNRQFYQARKRSIYSLHCINSLIEEFSSFSFKYSGD